MRHHLWLQARWKEPSLMDRRGEGWCSKRRTEKSRVQERASQTNRDRPPGHARRGEARRGGTSPARAMDFAHLRGRPYVNPLTHSAYCCKAAEQRPSVL